jgi:hypothetical protein
MARVTRKRDTLTTTARPPPPGKCSSPWRPTTTLAALGGYMSATTLPLSRFASAVAHSCTCFAFRQRTGQEERQHSKKHTTTARAPQHGSGSTTTTTTSSSSSSSTLYTSGGATATRGGSSRKPGSGVAVASSSPHSPLSRATPDSAVDSGSDDAHDLSTSHLPYVSPPKPAEVRHGRLSTTITGLTEPHPHPHNRSGSSGRWWQLRARVARCRRIGSSSIPRGRPRARPRHTAERAAANTAALESAAAATCRPVNGVPAAAARRGATTTRRREA